MLSWPSDFKPHAQARASVLERRRAALGDDGGIDWGHAEALALASLLVERHSVRISGQDAERGTFSHRQAVLHDHESRQRRTRRCSTSRTTRRRFEIYNCPLSEMAVLGFEYGYSTAARDTLVLWEAQYGDFVNVAQPIIDQFITSDRAKWGQDSGVVLLLPHGYEGQGPEHSSARLERFLQLCAENNMRVAYPSTPAQYFHILRRQALSTRAASARADAAEESAAPAGAASHLADLVVGRVPAGDRRSRWLRRSATTVRAARALHGQDLLRPARARRRRRPRARGARARRRAVSVAATRRSRAIVDRYPEIEEVVWAQEEPKNMGAWTFVCAAAARRGGERADDALHRAPRAREPGRGVRGAAREAAGKHRRGGAGADRGQAAGGACNLRRALSVSRMTDARDRRAPTLPVRLRAGCTHSLLSLSSRRVPVLLRSAARRRWEMRSTGFRCRVRVLVIGAHPDDEDTQLIAWLARGPARRDARTCRSRAATAARISSATSSAKRSA